MKKVFSTLLVLSIAKSAASSDLSTYGKISMIDDYGSGSGDVAGIIFVLLLLGAIYLFSKWIEKK